MQRQVILGKPIPPDRVLRLVKTIGGRITLLRHAAGMSQWDLAGGVHVSQSLISLWERGYATPDADAVKRLAKTLKCSQSYLTTDPSIAGEAA